MGTSEMFRQRADLHFKCSSDLRLYFGLGDERSVKKLEIIWPSGKKQILTDLQGDQMLLLEEANAKR